MARLTIAESRSSFVETICRIAIRGFQNKWGEESFSLPRIGKKVYITPAKNGRLGAIFDHVDSHSDSSAWSFFEKDGKAWPALIGLALTNRSGRNPLVKALQAAGS